MTKDDMIKGRIRARMKFTDEPYTEAQNQLADYPAPTADELAAADAIEYNPLFHQAETGGPIPAVIARDRGRLRGAAGDCFELQAADHFGPRPGEDGTLAIAARGFTYGGLPALALECVEIVESRGKIPGAWWMSLGIDLCERGWEYSPDGGGTVDWRAELTPAPDAPSAPVALHVHDGEGFTLFEGPLLVPPCWVVRTRTNPVGLLTIAGPVSGSEFPTRLNDDLVDDMLGTADLVAARIRVVLH